MNKESLRTILFIGTNYSRTERTTSMFIVMERMLLVHIKVHLITLVEGVILF